MQGNTTSSTSSSRGATTQEIEGTWHTQRVTALVGEGGTAIYQHKACSSSSSSSSSSSGSSSEGG